MLLRSPRPQARWNSRTWPELAAAFAPHAGDFVTGPAPRAVAATSSVDAALNGGVLNGISSSRARILILDCCFSGRAFEAMSARSFAAAWIARHGEPTLSSPLRAQFLELFEGPTPFGPLFAHRPPTPMSLRIHKCPAKRTHEPDQRCPSREPPHRTSTIAISLPA
ncbi:hypothetical protein [Nocardia tengchongensis]|uniref:hypothetical protein n=1 Tax=Nocardia tengchongensis TaxID=2055889 RepID=UPI0036C521CE